MIIPLLRIALISNRQNTCCFYKDLLCRRENIELETYDGVEELKGGCREKQYAGLIVDMWTHIGSGQCRQGIHLRPRQGIPHPLYRRP